MPAELVVNFNLSNPGIMVQFLGADGAHVDPPQGASVEWSLSNQSAMTLETDPANPFRAIAAFSDTGGVTDVTATISGADDVNNQPFEALTVRAIVQPARPGSVTIIAEAPPVPPQA